MKYLIILVALFAVSVMAISLYLAPDDLQSCQPEPGVDSNCMPADAIVAISGGDTPARTAEAINLYDQGWANKLILSGAAADKQGPSNAEAMRQQAIDAGVPASDIIIEESSETTKENATKTQEIIFNHSISDIILVTSAYHQRRAELEFKKLAEGQVTVRNHPVRVDNQWSGWWWLTPIGWYLAGGELVKITLFYAGGTR